MPRSGRQVAAALLHEALDDAVLETVEGDHRQPSARPQRALGGAQPGLELVELGVQVDADRLEGARCRVGLHPRVMAQRLAHHGGKLGGPRERASGDDRAGHRAGARLLAIFLDDPRDLGLVGLVEEFGGGQPGLAHPHVERAVLAEGEAALGLVELHRADPDVEHDPVDRQQATLLEQPVHLAESFLDQGQVGVRDEVRPVRDRIRIAIETDHSPRPRSKQGACITPRSERAIDQCFARDEAKRGDDFIDQYRHVARRDGLGRIGTHALRPRSSSRKRAMSFMSSGMRASPRNSFGFQIWNVSPAPRNSASSPICPFRRIMGGRTIRPDVS